MTIRLLPAFILACSPLLAVGCENDPEPDLVEQAPAYVISQVLALPTGVASFAAFVSSLDSDASVDPAASVELPNTSVLTSGPTQNSFLVSSGEAPEVLRYDIDDTGQVTEVGRVSFAGEGVSVQGFPPRVVTVSESKAYYLDPLGLIAVVFDPSELVIVNTFSLEILAAPNPGVNAEIVFLSREIFRDDELLLTVIYRDVVQGTTEPLARVLSLDTITDEVGVIDDRRCGYLANVVDVDGDLYFASDSFNGAFLLARPDANTPSCILRLPSGASAFDDYFVDLSVVTGSDGSGNLISGPGNDAYVLVYDESEFPVPANVTWAELYGSPAWRTVRITLGESDPTTVPIDALPPRSAASVPLMVDGTSLDGVTAADFTSTTLYRFDGAEPEPGLTFPGTYVGIVRIR